MIKIKSVEIETVEIKEHIQEEFGLKQICCNILQQKIIAKVAASNNISITDEEIEIEANKVRSALHLEKASDTFVWLEDNLLDPERWEIGINKRLLAKKLAKHLFGSKVEEYFAQNRLSYDRFVIYQLIIPYKRLAQELFYQIEEEEISFYQAAHLYDIDEERRYVCGYEGKVHRWNYTPDIAASIFKTPISLGGIIGPIESALGYHLFTIEDYIPAQLTFTIRQEIIDRMFAEWLNSELNYMLYRD